MTQSQRVVWTLLPNGFNPVTKRLKASILVSPRLTLEPADAPFTLAHFKDTWGDWPNTVNHADFRISVDGGAPHGVKATAKADSGVWAALFPLTTFVKPYSFTDMRGKVILSYPVAGIAQQIEQIYATYAVAADGNLPKRIDLHRHLGETQVMGVDQVLRQLRDEPKGRALYNIGDAKGPAAQSSGIRSPQAALSLLAAYHTPLEAEVSQGYTKRLGKTHGLSDPRESAKWSSRKRPPLPKPTDFQNLIDFHQIVASLAQYPELNQMAGLVIPVEIDSGMVLDGDHSLQLTVNWHDPSAPNIDPDVTPTIMTRRHGEDFFAAPRSAAGAITGRYLKLTGSGFNLVQMDVDGAGLKLKNLLTNLARPQPVAYDDDSFVEPDPADQAAALPSLRTAGVMLAQERRDLAIQTLFNTSGTLQDNLSGSPPDLHPKIFADDVVRGYRVDIREGAAGPWRTLCSRKTDFTFVNNGKTYTTPKEEGMVRLAAGSSTDGSNPDVIKIHEGLFAWRGWSLSAPEPGRTILPPETQSASTPDEPPHETETVGVPDENPPPGLPLKTTFTPTPSSLPQLRFGHSYTMRVRLVDLAGQSAAYAPGDVQPADAPSNAVVYRRYEPVESPSLALVHSGGGLEAPADGESMERIVIRTMNVDCSNYGPDNFCVGLQPPSAPAKARRHVVPPRTNHRFAEHHGALDTPAGKINPDLWNTLQTQDQPLGSTQIKKPGVKSGADPVLITYSVADETFNLPYLPDPLALGVAIRIDGAFGLDPTKIYKIPFYGDTPDPTAPVLPSPNNLPYAKDAKTSSAWPVALPFKIVVTGGPYGVVKWDGSTRELHIPLFPAERARVRISCLIPTKSLTMLAAAQMIVDQKPSQQVTNLLAALVLTGQHWMFTPWRTLELVHAVQKPLVLPELKALSPNRAFGSISAKLTIRTPVHAKSTSRLDLMGRWNDPLDDPKAAASQAGPVAQEHVARAFEYPLSRNMAPQLMLSIEGKEHLFGDTRYRRVIYKIDATTRFREFMPSSISSDEKQLKVTSAEVRTWIPNAAPPSPPNLLYVVPTFGWGRTTSGGQTSSMRAGGGLRVYLDRPWFTSGLTEMLGVVLPTDAATKVTMWAGGQGPLVDMDDVYRTSVTQWGTDPIWVAGRIKTVAPANSAFPLAKWRAPITFDGTSIPPEEGSDLPPADFPVADLPHPEHPDHTLNVAPHQVGYDADRGLWYADIVVRPPSNTYYPFIRLALARYNPISLSGAHLSHIVLAEFQQLTPDRLAIVTRGSGGTVAHVAIYGAGAAQQSQQNIPVAGQFLVETQVLDAGGDPDLDWRSVDAKSNPAQPAYELTPTYARPSLSLEESNAPITPQRAQAQQLVATENYRALVSRPDLILALQPPLLWQMDVPLPAQPPGGRRRLLITESEEYLTSPETLVPPPPGTPMFKPPVATSSRVVYLETTDV